MAGAVGVAGDPMFPQPGPRLFNHVVYRTVFTGSRTGANRCAPNVDKAARPASLWSISNKARYAVARSARPSSSWRTSQRVVRHGLADRQPPEPVPLVRAARTRRSEDPWRHRLPPDRHTPLRSPGRVCRPSASRRPSPHRQAGLARSAHDTGNRCPAVVVLTTAIEPARQVVQALNRRVVADEDHATVCRDAVRRLRA